MKKIAIGVILILLTITGTASGEIKNIRKMNGMDWKKYSALEKLNWVAGFMAGAGVVCNHSLFSTYRVKNKRVDWSDTDKSMQCYEWAENRRKEMREILGIYGITAGQVYNGMNEFYEDSRNKEIAMVDAIYVVKMEIEGKKPELIEAQKKYLRMQPIKSFSKKKIDYKNVKAVQENWLELRKFVEPKKDKPTKLEDYNVTLLFCYGIYE